MHTSILLLAGFYLSQPQLTLSQQIPLSQKQVEEFAIPHDACPLAERVVMKDGLISSADILTSSIFRQTQIERLGQAVRIPTVSIEAEDDPWSDFFDPFLDLHRAFERLFPLM